MKLGAECAWAWDHFLGPVLIDSMAGMKPFGSRLVPQRAEKLDALHQLGGYTREAILGRSGAMVREAG